MVYGRPNNMSLWLCLAVGQWRLSTLFYYVYFAWYNSRIHRIQLHLLISAFVAITRTVVVMLHLSNGCIKPGLCNKYGSSWYLTSQISYVNRYVPAVVNMLHLFSKDNIRTVLHHGTKMCVNVSATGERYETPTILRTSKSS